MYNLHQVEVLSRFNTTSAVVNSNKECNSIFIENSKKREDSPNFQSNDPLGADIIGFEFPSNDLEIIQDSRKNHRWTRKKFGQIESKELDCNQDFCEVGNFLRNRKLKATQYLIITLRQNLKKSV